MIVAVIAADYSPANKLDLEVILGSVAYLLTVAEFVGSSIVVGLSNNLSVPIAVAALEVSAGVGLVGYSNVLCLESLRILAKVDIILAVYFFKISLIKVYVVNDDSKCSVGLNGSGKGILRAGTKNVALCKDRIKKRSSYGITDSGLVPEALYELTLRGG